MEFNETNGELKEHADLKELTDTELDEISGGANKVERPCPSCGHELKWTAMAMEFMCFNKACPE